MYNVLRITMLRIHQSPAFTDSLNKTRGLGQDTKFFNKLNKPTSDSSLELGEYVSFTLNSPKLTSTFTEQSANLIWSELATSGKQSSSLHDIKMLACCHGRTISNRLIQAGLRKKNTFIAVKDI